MRRTSILVMAIAVAAGCATAPVTESPIPAETPTPPETPAERAAPVLRLVDITPPDGSQADSSTVVVASLAYHIPDFDPDATYAVSAVFAGADGRLFDRGGGIVELRSPAGIATFRHSLERVWGSGEDLLATPLTGTFFLLKVGPPPTSPDPSGVNPDAPVRTAVVVSPVRARTRTFHYNGAGPARSLAVGLLDALEEYWTYRPHKAFAIAHDGAGRWTSGYAFGFQSVEEAAERALEHCRTAAERREIDIPCHIIALDNESVEP